jgi:L-amino acid N-acyltransferase YncA
VDPGLTDGVVRLRPWREEDVAFVEAAGAETPWERLTLAGALGLQRRGEGVSLIVADAGSDATLGLLFLPARPQPGVVGVAYWIAPAARGRGVGTRAVRLAADWALAQPGTARVEAWVSPANVASQRLLAAAGFAREGVLRNFTDFGDRRGDVVVFSRVALRIFLAGGSGVLGRSLIPLLVAQHHDVAAMTRSPGKTAALAQLGAEPVVCDVYDAEALREAVNGFRADTVMHQLTDLPDDRAQMGAYGARNDRIRGEGTRNLVAAADGRPLYAQSIAWRMPPERAGTIAAHERMVLEAGGVVLRYGRLYGPGTWFDRPSGRGPLTAGAAAQAALLAVTHGAPGIYNVAEDDGEFSIEKARKELRFDPAFQL